MGNKSGRHRRVVDEKYTRPQGLYPDLDVDHKRLKKLILDSKLAPCYPGADESSFDLEECLICYLYYPSLNRSRCCKKSICTECFLKLKSPHSTRPTKCPFCKNWNYAVEYRGKRSEEEKGMERLEEQRVIEAQMRIQREELQDEEERMRGRQNNSPLNRNMDLSSSSVAAPSSRSPLRWDGIVSSQNPVSTPIISQPSRSRRDRENGFDLDLEDIMVMEAIWLSVQENEVDISLAHVNAAPPERFVTQYQSVTPSVIAGSSSSSFSHYSPLTPASASLNAHHRQPISFDEQMKLAMDESGSESSWGAGGQWGFMDHRNELAEARTSYTSSNASTEFRATAGTTTSDGIGGHQTQMHMNGSVLPESFEEQIVLAKAISLAEACSRTDIHGVTWL